MCYPAEAIANKFIELAEKDNILDLTPMKIQKLVFFTHGWYLGVYGEPLISDEVQAWRSGPVINSIYQEFKNYGNRNITKKAKKLYYKDGKMWLEEPKIDEDDVNAFAIIKEIWNAYQNLTPAQLSNITHRNGTPWHQITEEHDLIPKALNIPNELIEDYYKKKFEEQ